MERLRAMLLRYFWTVFFLAFLRTLGAVEAPLFDGTQPGPFAVETVNFEWRDASRDRAVPAKVYFPKDTTDASPVIVFSHGLGGSRNGYEYLGRYWASVGLVSVHVQHAGSDAALLSGGGNPMAALAGAILKPENVLNRPLDVSFALDQLTALAESDPVWKARLDLNRIGVAGHSFGANTVLLLAGQTYNAANRSFRDPRIKAAIAMSAPSPRKGAGSATNFSGISIPVFHMTGTLDDSPVGETVAADRRGPFDQIGAATEQYLLIFKGGDHMVFAGQRRGSGATAQDKEFQTFIKSGSLAFFEAYLRGSEPAKKWLGGGAFAAALEGHGTFETRGLGK